MTRELWAVSIGGLIGIIGGLSTTLLGLWWRDRRAKIIVSNAILAQLEFARDKADRFKNGSLTPQELKVGKPLFKALSENIGHLSETQAKASTKALLMYFELAESAKIERAEEVVDACTAALKFFRN